MGNTAYQLGRRLRRRGTSRVRTWIKAMTTRKRRQAERMDPENAPHRTAYFFWWD